MTPSKSLPSVWKSATYAKSCCALAPAGKKEARGHSIAPPHWWGGEENQKKKGKICGEG